MKPDIWLGILEVRYNYNGHTNWCTLIVDQGKFEFHFDAFHTNNGMLTIYSKPLTYEEEMNILLTEVHRIHPDSWLKCEDVTGDTTLYSVML